MYIGFRVELASRIIKKDTKTIVEQYNSSGESRILDLHTGGRITAEKTEGMVIARGDGGGRKITANVNFGIMIPLEKDLERIVQIINTLGNGRLIRERVKTFYDGQSMLNNLPELETLKDAFEKANRLMPGIIRGGWYYAPEAIWDE